MNSEYLTINYLWRRKKYKQEFEKIDDLYDIIINYIRINKLIVYGGTAIDTAIKHRSEFKDKLYEKYKLADYDVLTPKFEEIADSLSTLLMEKYGYRKIKVVTGLTGKTRKIFVNLSPEAIIDISYISEDHYEKLMKNSIIIDDIYIADPQFLKIHQYQNLVFQLFTDHYRIEKSLKKIDKLEKWFPIKEIQEIEEIEEYTGAKDIGYSIDELAKKYEVIFGGDYVFNIFYPEDKVKNPETIIYSNDLLGKHIPLIGRLRRPKYRILPLRGSTFYHNYTSDTITYKICIKMCLLYQYYYLNFYHKKIYYKQIKKLLDDPETFSIYKTDTMAFPKIYNPEHEMVKERYKMIRTRYLDPSYKEE
jgi:hypothetical protein